MSISIRVSDKIFNAAKAASKVEFRSPSQQLEFWATAGKAAIDNPDLPIDFIINTLKAKAEVEAGFCESFEFDRS
ncbi:MAG: hypothetical protein LEGION0398_MBIBDBAK_01009 [Legionellaceae bacterium]